MGKRGAFESEAIACGVLLLGPDTEYPAHSHQAEELYLPLAGHAWWRSGQSDWRLRPPGQWIHHPSWTTHAMRTAAGPCSRPMSGAPATSRRSRASTDERRGRDMMAAD